MLIAPTSHFIPTIFKAAIDAGKHVFCEKPHGIDIPGLKISMAAAETAKQKGLSVVSGLCWRYDPGVRVSGFTRDQDACHRDTNDYLFGTKGRCNLLNYRIEGENPWRYDQPRQNMYDLEHAALFQSIREGKPINNGHYMCLSSALGIAAQIACYTGAILTWEDVMSSKRSFSLPRYGWDVEPPVKPGPDSAYPSARQGAAEFEKWLI